MRVLLPTLAFVLVRVSLLAAAGTPEFEAAIALVKAKRYPEARAALERMVAADPSHAAACHQLGLVIKARNGAAAFEEALTWLGKAVELEPDNTIYLGDYGGTSLQLAGSTNSISAATKGRDAMEKAVRLDPDYLDAREGLVQFYQRAPWPIGSSAKADAHLEEIRKRDPHRAAMLSVIVKAAAKDFAAAFKLCDEALADRPDDYVALYQYGRTASISGQNLELGLACLQRCLTLDPPTPAAPTHSHVWQRIGNLHERLNHPDDARKAYQSALELDSSNSAAAQALARLK